MELKGEIRKIIGLCNDNSAPEKKPLCVDIPFYQRPYTWDNVRIESLIKDFYDNKANHGDDSKYFVGAVVLAEKSDTGRMEVIDGQQRITTVFLLNYLQFLLLRAQTYRRIKQHDAMYIADSYNAMLQSYEMLFGSKSVADKLRESKDAVLSLGGKASQEENREQATELWRECLSTFCESTGLYDSELLQDEESKQEYYKCQGRFLEQDKLALNYRLTSYNEALKEALASVAVCFLDTMNPEIVDCLAEGAVTSNNKAYISAMHCLFDSLAVRVFDSAGGDERGRRNLENMIKAIDIIIENLQFCVVVAGDEEDAFTLFEVLNDRAMAVDDLDLIKNQFFKTYSNTSGDSDIDKNRVIEREDSRWSDRIFSDDRGTTRAKRIAYYATVYLTGSSQINFKETERYRKNVREYLDVTYNEGNPYTGQLLSQDIGVFEMVACILKEYQVRERNNLDAYALEAQNKTDISITKKTMILLQAFGFDGVSASLVNLIIGSFLQDDTVPDKTIDSFVAFVIELGDRSKENRSRYRIIHKYAYQLWQAILMADGYKTPKEIANKAIMNVSRGVYCPDALDITREQHAALKEQFDKWVDGWKYGNRGTNLRVKILLHELLQSKREQGSLDFGVSRLVLKDSLSLDHLDPQNPNSSQYPNEYYEPSDTSYATRDDVVNGLGNMMLTDSKTNSEMSNKPMHLRLDEYQGDLRGHWLIREIEGLLEDDEFGRSEEKDGVSVRVPKDEFFRERKERLRGYFYAVVNMPYGSQCVELPGRKF